MIRPRRMREEEGIYWKTEVRGGRGERWSELDSIIEELEREREREREKSSEREREG